jgi:RNA polymerase sigma-70 factor, ECF subfamily
MTTCPQNLWTSLWMSRGKTAQVPAIRHQFLTWSHFDRQPESPRRVIDVNDPQFRHTVPIMTLSVTLAHHMTNLLFEEGVASGSTPLDQVGTLDRFLASVEKRAFQIARVAVRDADDALDIVQDAMLQLARRYGARPSEEWKPLFYRILQNRIRDCQRRRMVKNKLFGWLPGMRFDDEEIGDPYEATPDESQGPADRVITGEAMQTLERALQDLPARQLEAFLLRAMEGMDVADTAAAMGCTEGSVKTHYSRAVHTLRERLGDVWGEAS